MCYEGGCGACTVAVTAKHPLTEKVVTFAVNSCLVSIFSCHGWEIHTVDGIGNKQIGHHPIQKTLAKFNGTQCGFCSPGMVMNMYPLYQANANMQEIESSFSGNMCRCTGYRSILTAFKSLASDANTEILGTYPDIEDFETCNKNRETCQRKCDFICKRNGIPLGEYLATKSKWFKVYSVNEIFDVLNNNPGTNYQLVAGNTAKGVYHLTNYPDIYIDVTNISTLIGHTVTNKTLTVGANKTLKDTICLFRKTAKEQTGFAYLDKLADHIALIAHVAVRNIGTLAGNLSIKHQHNEFPSDLFLILETVGATLTIASTKTTEIKRDLVSYLSYNMNRKVIKSITFPKLTTADIYRSYKIMPRAQNAHAMVNAGFLLKMDRSSRVVQARIVYGGINPSFVHAIKAETYITKKALFDNETLQGVFTALNEEIHPNDDPPSPSPKFRKDLAIALLYKFVLNIAPEGALSPRNKSGGQSLKRPISSGVQDFQTNESLYPLTQPIPKLEALAQTSGEAEFITDFPDSVDQLYASFVTAEAPANSTITNIDKSEAMKLEGVVAFYDKNDIPGENSFFPLSINYPTGFGPDSYKPIPEEIFCSGVVKFYSQTIGMVVAKSQSIADKAITLVKVTYSTPKTKPLLTIRQVLKAGATDKIFFEAGYKASRKGNDIKHVIKGTFDTNWQYHYHMETQICSVIPKEDSLDIYPGTQWMDIIQIAASRVLNIPENKINISVRRVGGGFGGKITRNCLVSCAAALAAYKLNKPVKMRMDLSTNMNVIGKRFPSASDYEVGVNDKGEIQYLDNTFYLDYGSGGNEPIIGGTISIYGINYKHDTWDVSGYYTKTDSHSGAWMRAPGTTPIFGMIESLMEHLAMTLKKSSLEIRYANMDPATHKKVIQFMEELRQWSDYDNRVKEVEAFNEVNRWRKQGISIIPMTFSIAYVGNFSSTVAIYANDGTVAVSHCGIEIGQGINTKVAQVCAFALDIPIDMVTVKRSNNFSSANSFPTGGSITSESVCFATIKACEILLARMKPVKNKMSNPTWQEWVRECQTEYIDLIASHTFNSNDPVKGYDVYGVCATEVEVDILTGTHQVIRVDILEDTGNSMSPSIDIGQVEGAFIMGLGYWTTEEIVQDKDGRMLTNRTWNYKIPCSLDIPIDFRVKFPKNMPNPNGVLHSKATGEPALCLAASLPLAIRRALASARTTSNANATEWFPINGPSTVENTFLNSLNDYRQYTL